MTKDREEDPVIYAPEKRSSLLGIIEKILAVIFTVLLWCFLLFYIYSRLFQTESMERTTSMMEFLLLAVGVIFWSSSVGNFITGFYFMVRTAGVNSRRRVCKKWEGCMVLQSIIWKSYCWFNIWQSYDMRITNIIIVSKDENRLRL